MGMYIIAFIAFGLAGTLTLYVSNKFNERSSKTQLRAIKDIGDSQTRELVSAMGRINGISQRIAHITDAMARGETGPETVAELSLEAQSLSANVGQWVEEAERRQPIIRAELQVDEASAAIRAQRYSDLIRPYYAYFLDSLESHIKAMRDSGWEIQVDHRIDLPETVVEAREPVINGVADFLVEYAFPTGRKWTIIFTSGGASISDLFLPYFHVALAKPDERDHGPNYFELHMQNKKQHGVVFSLRSNFDSVRNEVGKENGAFEEFKAHFDHTFQVLLEKERAYKVE